MSLPFDFIADGVALSLRAEGRNNWRDCVKNFAKQRWPAQPPVAEEVMVTVTCFHDHRHFDLDNILKPILDAMNKLIYVDDVQITDLHCRKRDLNADLEVRNPSPALREALARLSPFVHIIVAAAPDQGVLP